MLKSVLLKLHCIFCCALVCLLFPSTLFATDDPSRATATKYCAKLEVYSKKGCPHCAKAYQYLDAYQLSQPDFVVIKRDIADTDHLQAFIQLNQAMLIDKPGVPTFNLCGQVWVGYSKEVLETKLLANESQQETTDISEDSATQNTVSLPLIGDLSLQQIGLPAFTVVIGLIDGFNPCAMWVLMFLLSLLVNVKSRKRIVLIAGVFVLVSGLVYFAFMAAWLNMYLVIGLSRTMQVVIALLALIIGTVHIKDYFLAGQGISFSLPESQKPGLYARVRGIVQAENIIVALIAVTVLAVMVNFLELLCTAGLPALYTQILVLQGLATYQYYAYLALYNLAYIFDDALMVAIVVYSLSRYKLTQVQGRWLKLLSGSVIFILGIMLLVAPDSLF